MKFRTLLANLFCLLMSWTAWSQSVSPQIEVSTTQAQFLGTTQPLRDLAPAPATSAEKKKRDRGLRGKTIPNFNGRGIHPPYAPDALPQGPDALWQTAQLKTVNTLVEPLVNIEGMDENIGQATPPDPAGDIGKDYYIQMVNATVFQLFDKTGIAITGPMNLNTLWNDLGFGSGGDPIVLYDEEAQRWIMTEFPPFQNFLLVAVSETSDPMGAWSAYSFSTPSFPDYPKYSIWSNALVVTTNEGGPGQHEIYFIDREALLNLEPVVDIQRIQIPGFAGGPGFQVSSPIDWSGSIAPPASADPMIIRINDDAWGAPQDQIEIWSFDVDFANPNNTTATTEVINTAPFDSNPCAISGGFGFDCIPQPNGTGIDGLPEVVMNLPQYRNFGNHEAIVCNFITDASGNNLSGIRWMELRRNAGQDWTLYQEGTFAPDDGNHRFMGAIAIDASGNIGMGYSISGPNTFPSLAFTGRRASDPLGEMTVDEFVVAQGSGNAPFDRFGDYAAMAVDPVNERTFWFTGEYQKSNGWATKIVAFELSRDTNDISPAALLLPSNGPDLTTTETVQVTVENVGLEPQTAFEVGYTFEGGAPTIEAVNVNLGPGDVYTHTFATTVNMSTVGDYEFVIFTNLDSDTAPFNDTLRVTRSNLPRYDAGITDIFLDGNFLCGSEQNVELVLTNFGVDPLTSATITLELNGMIVYEETWTGNLAFGASTTINLTFSNFINGNNTLLAYTSLPNGETDEIPDNDSAERDVNVVLAGEDVTLVLTTDIFPEETTWALSDEIGNVLFTGGPYAEQNNTFFETWCLAPNQCYTFTIFDSYGDGLSFFDGSYQILDENGEVITSIINVNFGFEEENDFCLTGCALLGTFSTSPATGPGANDGILMANGLNGTPPYQYSIDGGQTFQSSGTFSGLAGDDYEVVILDANDCTYTETITVIECALVAAAQSEAPTTLGGTDGSITVTATGGTPPYEYTLEGAIPQGSPVFENLAAGTYNLTILDFNGCEVQLEVVVDVLNGISTVPTGTMIQVNPNPTNGLFDIRLTGYETKEVFLPVVVMDQLGRILFHAHLTNYSGAYVGQFSLYDYPAGVYLIRFTDPQLQALIRVVKQ